MADKQYFVITSTYGGNLATGNIILLPGGGRLNNADITINDEDLVIAGNYSGGYNIFLSGSPTTPEDSSSTYIENSISFTNGGRLNLSAQTADRTTDPNQSAYSDSAIQIIGTWDHTISQSNQYPSSATYEINMFKSTGGTFSVISDLCGTISQNQSVSLTGLTTSDGKAADNSSGNTIITTAIRANSLEVYNNFNGTLSATNTGTLIQGYANANVNNNTIRTAAIWTDSGNVTFGGVNTGTINSTTENVTLKADPVTLKQDDSGTDPAPATGAASASGNAILTYGILAGANGDASIIFQKGFDAKVNTTLNNVDLSSMAKGENNKAAVSANLETYGMYAKELDISGIFSGNINTTVSNLTLALNQAIADNTNAISHTIAGLYVTDKINANYLSGTITVDASQNIDGSLDTWKGNIYGIYAGNDIISSGVFDTSITITSNNSVSKTYETVIGIKTTTLTAESLAADITITNNMGLSIGVQIDNWQNDLTTAFNVIESPFDIVGDITVNSGSSKSFGGYGIVIKDAGNVNLRISSKIQAYYAVYSGSFSYTASQKAGRTYTSEARSSGDDTLEIAAGAELDGTIELGGGTNNIYIDSNARIKDLGPTNGPLTNVWFRLNQYGAVQQTSGFNYTLLGSQDVILGGNFSFDNTTVYVDLNDAGVGEYKLFQSADFASGRSVITLAYQGETYNISIKELNAVVGDITVNCTVDSSNVVSINVDRAEGSYSDRLANTVYLDLAENGTGTFTLSNEIDRVNRADDYQSGYALVLTYDIYDQATGDLIQSGATKTVAVTGINGGSIDLGLESGQIVKNVQSELTQDNNRISTLTVSGTENPDDNSCTINWNTALAEGMTLNSGYIYELEYSVNKNGSAGYGNSTVIYLNYLATTYTITGIEEGDSVKVRIRLKDNSSATNYTASEWSDTLKLTNAGSVDTAQQVTGLITSRPSHENTALWILEWDDMRSAYESGLQYYEVQFFIINNDTTTLTEDEINAIWSSDDHGGMTVYTRRVTANNFYLSGLSQTGQGIYWRVKAVANDGAGADASSEVWSENYHFSPVGGNVTPPSASTDAPNITINSEYQYISGSPANSITVDWKGSLATTEAESPSTFSITRKREKAPTRRSVWHTMRRMNTAPSSADCRRSTRTSVTISRHATIRATSRKR